jgi:hypothetical protein
MVGGVTMSTPQKTPKEIMQEEANAFSYHRFMTEGNIAVTSLMKKAFEKILTQKRQENMDMMEKTEEETVWQIEARTILLNELLESLEEK